ncbi:MAG: GNAT family N-acetyltransferase [Defluviitaleaceae bacterium]|nr:GNAT family N-acetyltransferase [Defluviitaleaceae bacterium]
MEKLILIKPDITHKDEILDYQLEFRQHDDHSHGDSGLYNDIDILAWIINCRLHEKAETLPNPKHVTATQYMMVREGTTRILGMINLRHTLGEKGRYLAEHGGHIGFGIRPTERRKGYAKVMLQLCLEKCRDLGLEIVLLTCDIKNEGSRRTIQACGGQFERIAHTGDEVDERYWINLLCPLRPVK